MVERVFLTDTRREVLAGEFEGENSTLESHKSRIRKRGQLALEELIEVAQSDEIDNEGVFSPTDIERLIHALMTPSDGPLKPPWQLASEESDRDERWNQHREKYPYQHMLHQRLNFAIGQYDEQINQVAGPDEKSLFLGEIVEGDSE